MAPLCLCRLDCYHVLVAAVKTLQASTSFVLLPLMIGQMSEREDQDAASGKAFRSEQRLAKSRNDRTRRSLNVALSSGLLELVCAAMKLES